MNLRHGSHVFASTSNVSLSLLSCRYLVLVGCFAFARAAADECPMYREPDRLDPTSTQFLAPDGCRCVDGMSGVHCGFCDASSSCQSERAHNSSRYVCRSDVFWSPEDTYKSLKCNLTGALASLFTGGQAYFHSNISSSRTTMAVFNQGSVNKQHAVDCEMTGCEYGVDGGSGVRCDRVDCRCTDQCATTTKIIVERSMSGKPVAVTFGDVAPYVLSVDIQGSMFPIEAACEASACTMLPFETMTGEDMVNKTVDELQEIYMNMTVDELQEIYNVTEEVEPDEDRDTKWNSVATFALTVVSAVGGATLFLVVLLLLLVPRWKWRGVHVATHKEEEVTKLVENGGTNNTTDLPQDAPSPGSSSRRPVPLECHHIHRFVVPNARTPGREKAILHDVSGRFEPGTLTAVLGPSGSGKTSLLHALAAVSDDHRRRSVVSGRLTLGAVTTRSGASAYRRTVAFVPQHDALYDTLTVQESLEYAAALRMGHRADVARTLDELRLTAVADSRVGRLSGGERKRVGIGMELVAQPAVLVLDEPTSGLDSFVAHQIVNVLKDLTRKNHRIVILSVHQPSIKSFRTFDRVLLLGGGSLMYRGTPEQVEDYFEQKGFPCPDTETVPDHMLNVVSDKDNHDTLKIVDADTETEETYDKHEKESYIVKDAHTVNDVHELRGKQQPLPIEIMILLDRTAKDIFRNRELFLLQLTISVLLAVFTGAIFNDVSNNIAGFQNRMGAFYFSLSFFAFASLSSMDIFVKERHIFVRETGSMYFRPISYLLAKTILDMILLRVVPVTVFTLIFYWMMGLRDAPETFFIFWATLILFNVCAGIMSVSISVAMPTVGQANLLAAVWFLIMLLFGGFLMNVDSMESWYSWLKYASIFYYSFETLMTNELSGLLLSFDAPGYPAVPIYGEVFLATIGMKLENQLRNLICLCSLVVGEMVVAYVMLLLRVPPSADQQFRKMEQEEKKRRKKLKGFQPIRISLPRSSSSEELG